MRIGFVIQHINALGGTERAACAVMNGLADSADIHLFEVHSRGPAAFGLDPRIRTVSLFDRHVSLLNQWPRLMRRLRDGILRERLDVLVVVESTHALYAVPAARRAGCRCVVWEHFNFRADLGKRKRGWGRWVAARWADDVVVLTHRDIALWEEGCQPRARMTCIPNMAPPISATPYRVEGREVLALGRLSKQKGFDRLLAAWARVEADPRGASWHLRIVGDGPNRAALQAQAASLHRATVTPAENNVAARLSTAGLLSASSRFEGLPMVLLEATAFGIPVVAFDCETGPAEIVDDGRSGLLVPEGDVAALADALLGLMASDERRVAMADAARRQAAGFSREAVLPKWRSLFGISSG